MEDPGPSVVEVLAMTSTPSARMREPGPWLLIGPLLVAVLLVLWQRREAGLSNYHAPPPPQDEERPVAGWSGTAELASGERLEVRLTPLSASPRQQAFDAVALQEVLELPDGQPWRLDLVRTGTGSDGSEDLAFDGLHITGSDGSLQPLPRPEGKERPLDPVAVLLALPEDSLGPGQEISLVVWGETPGDPLRLSMNGLELELLADEVPRSAVVRSLAQREGVSGGGTTR